MVRNLMEIKKNAQKGLRVADILITIISFAWAGYLYNEKGFYFWFWFWFVFAVVSLVMVITNPTEKIENKVMGSFIKGRK